MQLGELEACVRQTTYGELIAEKILRIITIILCVLYNCEILLDGYPLEYTKWNCHTSRASQNNAGC